MKSPPFPCIGLLLPICLLLSGVSAFAADAITGTKGSLIELEVIEELFPASGVSLGQGWFQRLGGRAPGRCVDGLSTALKNASVVYSFDEIFDREQIYSSLNVGVKASYLSTFSAAGEFAKSTNIEKSKRNVLANVTVIKDGEFFGPFADGRAVKLTDNALTILNKTTTPARERLRIFDATCGDTYVDTIKKGGRYMSMFQTTLDETTRKERYAANMKVGIGGFGGKASFSKETTAKLTHDSTKINTTQEGGNLELPLTAAEAFAAIKTFPTFKDEGNAFSIVLKSYESLPGWPSDMRNLRESNKRLSYLAGLQVRMEELASVYFNASVNSYLFAYPFQDRACPEGKIENNSDPSCLTAQTSYARDVLLKEASCLDEIIKWCSVEAGCDLEALPKDKFGVCVDPVMVETAATKVVASSANTDEKRKVWAKLLRGALSKVFVTKEANDDPSKSTYAIREGWLAHEYLIHLAKLPLMKNISEDDIAQIKEYCKARPDQTTATCESNTTKLGSVEGKNDDAARLFKDWVLQERLSNLVRKMCETSTQHLLCVTPEELFGIVSDLPVIFTPIRGFPVGATTVVAPPAPPIIQEVKKEPRCSGGGGGRGRFSCNPN